MYYLGTVVLTFNQSMRLRPQNFFKYFLIISHLDYRYQYSNINFEIY